MKYLALRTKFASQKFQAQTSITDAVRILSRKLKYSSHAQLFRRLSYQIK
jgi:hypothetical protein